MHTSVPTDKCYDDPTITKKVFVRKIRQSTISTAAKPFHISMLSPLEVEFHRVLGYTGTVHICIYFLRYDKIILVGVTQPHEMGHEWLLQSPNPRHPFFPIE